MVVSTAQQLRSTYRLWKRFSMPVDDPLGTRDAIAVQSYVANQLNSAYTIMVTSMIVNLWCIFFALAFYFFLLNRRGNGKKQVHWLSTSLWNKRGSMSDSFFELLSADKKTWRRWWIYPVILAILACWISQLVLSIIVPPYIFLGNAAPVNPDAVFVPPDTDNSSSAVAQLFALDVPSALRAAGSAQVASSDVQKKVDISLKELGTTADGESVRRVEYGYTVTGADLGLQYYPSLHLRVDGACTTEYGWLSSSDNSAGYTNDTYSLFGDAESGSVSLSLFDGAAPVAFFYLGSAFDDLSGNMTWAAYVSSVDRITYTPGRDPLYATDDLGDGLSIVKPRRPVLSCWQADVWSYSGRTSTITGLNSTMLPGLYLPDSIQIILARYLGTPKIVSMGIQLGLSSLVSSTAALGSVFDAGSSSMFADLNRLVLAAYIATTNVLTDTTLYPSSTLPGNLVREADGSTSAGVGDFVVWSVDVSTLSIRALIIIPVLAVVLWAAVLIVLNLTPLRTVNALDAVALHQTLVQIDPDARPGRGRKTWELAKQQADFDPLLLSNEDRRKLKSTGIVTEKVEEIIEPC